MKNARRTRPSANTSPASDDACGNPTNLLPVWITMTALDIHLELRAVIEGMTSIDNLVR